MVKLIPVL